LIFWIDAQLSPYLAKWISSEFGVEARPVRDLGLRDARDREIFLAAREAGATVMTR
jgi:predicted nuclease of predicted toxin-antitoxin system